MPFKCNLQRYIEVAQAPALATTIRRRALDVVAFLARHKSKALLRAKLVQPLLRVLCPLCGEPKEAELAGEDDVEAEEVGACTLNPKP